MTAPQPQKQKRRSPAQQRVQQQYATTVLQVVSMLEPYAHPDNLIHPEAHSEIRSQTLSMLHHVNNKAVEARTVGGSKAAVYCAHIAMAADHCMTSSFSFRERILLIFCAMQEIAEIDLFDEGWDET